MVFCTLKSSHAHSHGHHRTHSNMEVARRHHEVVFDCSPHSLRVCFFMYVPNNFQMGLVAGRDEEDDTLSILTMSSPRSRAASEVIFADIESLISRSERPPVGTTRPPVYPRQVVNECAVIKVRRSQRIKTRVVNKPLPNRCN